jgi:tripartite-type tricarboxylate transporter receptor subunit TctC
MTTDLISGIVPIGIDVLTAYLPFFKSGQLVPLAVTTTTRDPVLPNVPTVSEQGLPGFEATAWWGILASKLADGLVGILAGALAVAVVAIGTRVTERRGEPSHL